MVLATIKGVGSTARSAARAYAAARARFARAARRNGWMVLGARHLARGKRDTWIDHAHVIVAASQAFRASLAADVRSAGAWPDRRPIESIERVLRYTLNGVVRRPAAEHAAAWLAATVGRPSIIAPRRSTDKRKRATVTHRRPIAERVRERVAAVLAASPPMSESALRRRLTPAHRAALCGVLTAMVDAREIERVPGVRGLRWAPLLSPVRPRKAVVHV
jgi:hypothetical protein